MTKWEWALVAWQTILAAVFVAWVINAGNRLDAIAAQREQAVEVRK